LEQLQNEMNYGYLRPYFGTNWRRQIDRGSQAPLIAAFDSLADSGQESAQSVSGRGAREVCGVAFAFARQNTLAQVLVQNLQKSCWILAGSF
jgi:hypothetical protein